jgi:serine/threonine protein kinase
MSSGRRRKMVHGYEIGQKLGSGAFAKVYRAKHIESGQQCAVKCIKL